MISPWFVTFIFLAAGISIAYNHLWLAALVVSTVLVLFANFERKYARQVLTGIAVLGISILYFCWVEVPLPLDLQPQNNVIVRGTVESEPSFDGEKSRFVLHTDSSDIYKQKLQVSCYFNAKLQKGEMVQLRGSMKAPPDPGNPGEFNYPRYLSYHRIYYLFSVKQEHQIKVLSPPGLMQRKITSVSSKTENLIRDVLPADEAAILIGMLLGNVEGMDENQYSEFQKTGIIHIFSVSGVHIGFLLLLCTWFTSLLKLSRKANFFTCLFLMLLYGTMVGWPVCVVRSVLMATLGLIAYYMGRESQLLNSLGLSGLIILIVDPYALFTISFQLSFLATWGLIYLFPLVKKRLNYNNRIWDLVLVSLCAQLAVIPLIAYYFNLFSPLSLLSNLLTTYLSGFAVILGFLTLITGGVLPVLGSFLLYPAGLSIELILILNKFVLNLPGSYFWVATPPVLLTVCYYGGLLSIIKYWQDGDQRRYLLPGLALISIFLVYIFIPATVFNYGLMEAVFIDVGQGDSILLKSPAGKFILVDGGGSELYDVGSGKVLPYLHRRGIRKLDLVINTHPDTDHLQGIEKVVEEMDVGVIAIPCSLKDSEKYVGLKRTAQRKSTGFVTLKKGQTIRLEKGMNIKVLYPDGKAFSGDQFNDQSLVLRVDFDKFSMLLTGDVGSDVLQTLVKDMRARNVTVLKIPHHGSKGSLWPDFYEKARPQIAVISVGANNIFGHPHSSVLKALQERGIRILRTDTNGAIVITSDGKSMELESTKNTVTK
ncbi:MAG: DNA internalization-related competence protein ComEC/Rec2 [Syntrophomonas sp.]